VSVQPVISKSADSVAEEDRSRDNETDFGVSSRRDQGVRLIWELRIFRHEKDSTVSGRGAQVSASPGRTAEAAVSTFAC